MLLITKGLLNVLECLEAAPCRIEKQHVAALPGKSLSAAAQLMQAGLDTKASKGFMPMAQIDWNQGIC